MGRTLNHLMAITGIDSGNPSDLTAFHVKQKMKYRMMPNSEVWRVSLCLELLEARDGEISVDGFTVDEREEILRSVCSD